METYRRNKESPPALQNDEKSKVRSHRNAAVLGANINFQKENEMRQLTREKLAIFSRGDDVVRVVGTKEEALCVRNAYARNV